MSTQCRYCGEAVRPDTMFCPGCGQIVGATAVVPPFGAGVPAPEPGNVGAQAAEPAEVPPLAPVPLPRFQPGESLPTVPSTPDAAPAPAQPSPATPAVAAPVRLPTSVVLPDGQRLALNGVLVLGRAPETGAGDFGGTPVRLDDPERRISRVHLIIERNVSGVYATDNGSANGTVVERNGEARPLERGAATALVSGDALLVGGLRLMLA